MSAARRWLIAMTAVSIAAILAFPLRSTLYEAVIVPVAFIIWRLHLLYRSLPQILWWALVVFLVLFLLVLSLLPQSRSRRRVAGKSTPVVGQVEGLAGAMQKAEQSTYFKWLVANRLGKLAYQILLQRESGRERSVFAPLVGPDWEPPKPLQSYLETGLHGSFADFPNVRTPFRRPPPTPLDLDVGEAVQFIESQVESSRGSV